MTSTRRWWRLAIGPAVMLFCGVAVAADTADTPEAPASLVAREQRLLQQFRDLERSFLRLADLLASSDPRRAALLRSVFEQAREAEVGDRLDTIVKLLEQSQLLKAGSSQSDAIDRMKELLALLESGDADRSLTNTKEEVRQFISRVAKLIGKQRGIEGSTEFGGDEDELASRQESLAEEARRLAGDIGGFAKRMDPRETEQLGGEQERKPGDGQSQGGESKNQRPSEGGQEGQEQSGGAEEGTESGAEQGDDEASRARRTRARLQAAEQRMRQARKRLDDANRRDARAEQQKAIEELETARAELEEILRQMREEEVERLLVQLETRVRAMLRAQRAVLAGAEKLASSSERGGRDLQLESARLGREQTGIATDATKALELVRDDGSAVAIPQALEQVRDDAHQAAGRLTRGDVGGTTRGILEDLVASLTEMLAALEKAQREQQEQRQNPSGGRPAQPGEQPLVDSLAELKMIRSLQMRVNIRTERFARLLTEGAEEAEEPELMAALERLADRQRAIERAARDIVGGRTE